MAYLATEPEKVHSRQKLASLFWPDLPIETARTNLRQVLLNLRQVLGDAAPACLIADQQSIRFNPECAHWLDVTEFSAAISSCSALSPSNKCNACSEQMERAAEIYQGSFLDGLTLENLPEFEDWLCIKRETYHRQALGLLERLSGCHEQNGNLTKALHFANRYLELEPWNEDGHRKTIRLLAQSGQTGTALAQFESCKRVLQRELGVSPDAETIGLLDQIRSGQFITGNSRAESDHRPFAVASLAERRQVTALYCGFSVPDVSDPEEIAERWLEIQNHIIEIIRKFGGYIAQNHGTAVLGYFGYPKAQEDAARRAVHAALALLKPDPGHADIRISSGLHTGMIVTSADLPDSMGLTSTTAIRLRDLNYPVLISEATQQLVSGYFHLEPIGLRQFENTPQPFQTFHVTGESGALHRLDAADRLTPYVGRSSEIDTLLTLWKQAKLGTRRIVFIKGEAGIGKSRLVHTLKELLLREGCTVRELRCFPEFSQSPFHPIIAMIESLYGLAPDESTEAKLSKLVHNIEARYPNAPKETVPLLAQLLSLSVNEPSSPSPQWQKEALYTFLIGLLQMLAAQQPVLYIVEDLHWIDPSTLELLTLFANGQNHRGSILMLLTARPEFDPTWERDNAITMELHPLSDNEVATMIGFLKNDIQPETVAHIIARADGIPLFVEEMAKMARDGLAILPTTLHDLLEVKLDALSGAKRTAQLAATIGREFSLDLLREISLSPPLLDELLNSGLVSRAGKDYQFKHALIQEAAYQSQTKADRQSAHQKIAKALQTQFTETLPEILAQHWSAGGETKQAIEYWIKAGKRASQHSANTEAIQHFSAGLQLLGTLPQDEQRDQLEFALQVGLGIALHAVQGYGSKEATQANARVAALGELVGDSPELFLSKWARVMNTIAGVGSREAIGAAYLLLEIAGNDPLRRQAAHYAVADAAFWLGEFESTRVHTEKAVALYRPDQHQVLLQQFGEDLSVSCSAYLSWAFYFLGFPDRAQQVCAQMLKQARGLGDHHTLALALCFASVLHRWLGKREETLTLSAETITVSRQYGFPVWLAAGEMTHGWACAMHGQQEGIVELESSIAGMRAAIGGISVVFLSALVEAYVYLQMPDAALDLIAEALADVACTGDGHFTAELHRLKGECLMVLSKPLEARICFDQALAMSRTQGAKSLELRAAISLVRHFNEKQLLSEVYSWFTEGFDTPALAEARKLLDG